MNDAPKPSAEIEDVALDVSMEPEGIAVHTSREEQVWCQAVMAALAGGHEDYFGPAELVLDVWAEKWGSTEATIQTLEALRAKRDGAGAS